MLHVHLVFELNSASFAKTEMIHEDFSSRESGFDLSTFSSSGIRIFLNFILPILTNFVITMLRSWAQDRSINVIN
jgi:hypothetical protein